VDGKSLPAEQLSVTMDPRSSATTAELQQDFTATYEIFSASLQARRALAELGSVKDQLTKGSFTNPQIVQQRKTLLASVEAITSGTGAGLGLDQANSEITAALNVAESSDRAIPAQAIQLYAEASAASELRIKEWATLKQGALAQFNQQLKRERLAPIAISAIEHEVYLLMTQ
jgi:hypothetical protein